MKIFSIFINLKNKKNNNKTIIFSNCKNYLKLDHHLDETIATSKNTKDYNI